jgi:hypothetical protein
MQRRNDGEMFMTIGFTGTQNGMTKLQQEEVTSILLTLKEKGYDVVRHGDCIGADAWFHNKSVEMGFSVIKHPPENPKKRAFCKEGETLPEKEYLTRNRDIVDNSDVIIATPSSPIEVLRSGTWATIRYSKNSFKPYVIVTPKGDCLFTNNFESCLKV